MDIKLIHGDCIEEMSKLDDNSIDMCLTDPPYEKTQSRWDFIISIEPMWAQLKRIVKPSGAILLFGQNPYTAKLVLSNLRMYKYEWIWEKTEAKGHFNAKKMPLGAHEFITVFYQKPPTYNFIKTTGHIRKTAKNVDRAKKQSDCYGKQKGITSYDSTERYPRTVQLFKSDKQNLNLHPNQKPVALLEYFIKTYSNEGEMVIDFTMGSASTGKACKNLKRRFIGIDDTKKYYDRALERLK